MKWKADNRLNWYARCPKKPLYKHGENHTDYAKRLLLWNSLNKLWQTAPQPEDFDLSSTLNEHFEIRVSHILIFGAQHIKLFNFRLLSEMSDFENFLFVNGFRYEYIEKKNGSAEIDFDSSYDFTFSEESAKFKLAVESSDKVHITGFYFYNENGYKNERQKVNTIADIHDFLMKDSRVVTKKIEKDNSTFIQDYIATYEAARVENSSIYITTIERYKKLPMHKWYGHKIDWIILAFVVSVLLIAFGILFALKSRQNSSNEISPVYSPVKNQVYICTGPQAKSYHKNKECYGLQSCSADVEEITLHEAEDQGRHPCRYCWK